MSATDHTDEKAMPRVAAYLRCFPYDMFRSGPHLEAILDHLKRLTLPAPCIFFDNGLLASEPLPQLQQLLDAVAAGSFDVVILPGPFVLSLNSGEARVIMQQIADHGCQVIELPSRQAYAHTPSGQRSIAHNADLGSASAPSHVTRSQGQDGRSHDTAMRIDSAVQPR